MGQENFIPSLPFGTIVDTLELLRAAVDFQRRWVESGAEVRRTPYGAIVRTARFPLIYMANLAWVERLPREGIEPILEDLDAAFGGTAVAHRNVVFEDAQAAFENQEAFASRGFRPLADLVMARVGLPACITNSDLIVREVGTDASEDHYRRMRMRLFEGIGYPPEECRQLYEIAEERGAALGQKEFVGYYRDEPAGTIALWPRGRFGLIEDVATMPEFRGRGVARTMLFEISKRALSEGCEYTVLFTDPFDSPQVMYKTLGYLPVGEIRSFLKGDHPPGP